MVRIRYSELPVGLHVATRSNGRYTIVYLLPGLTPAQRRDALTFARRSARVGQGPSLPATDMAFAVIVDRARTTGRNIAAAMRRHPGLLLPPLVVLVSAAVVFVLLAFLAEAAEPGSNAPHAHRTPASVSQRPADGSHAAGGHALVRGVARSEATVASQAGSPAGQTPSPSASSVNGPAQADTHVAVPPTQFTQPSPAPQHFPLQVSRGRALR